VAEAGLPALCAVRRYVPYGPNLRGHRRPRSMDRLPDGHILHIDWQPNADWAVPWGDTQAVVTVWMRDVPSAQRAEVSLGLQSMVLPELIEWLKHAQVAPEGWKVLRHGHAWAWVGGKFHGEEIESAGFGQIK